MHQRETLQYPSQIFSQGILDPLNFFLEALRLRDENDGRVEAVVCSFGFLHH